MIALTFSKSGQEDIVLTEDDLFDFSYEENAYSGEAFELGGVCARSIYMIIDNNTQRFSRGTFANCRVKLEIDGNFYGYYNAELPKRRNGVIELTAYDDMVKLDVEFPADYTFPQTFWAVYAQCVYEAGLAADISFDNVILNGVWDNGIISADYTDYIYANSCRNLVSGMAEWNGGFARINDDGRLQVDKFGTDIVREYSSPELMELDYSDDTVVFSKVKTSQKNKTYEKGDDSGYTLTLKNQYISYGLDDTAFETYLTQIYDYYNGFSLTPMSFMLADPDFGLHIGDRVQVYDEEEQVTICGNVSKIEISGNCSMKVTCGGFENVASSNNFTPTSFSQINQAKTAGVTSGVGMKSPFDESSEIFNCYPGGNNSAGAAGNHQFASARGMGCKASGFTAVADGFFTTASGRQSRAHGYYTTASGVNSCAEGQQTTASGENAHSEGYQAQAIGSGSHAENAGKATGNNSHAGGDQSEATGYAHFVHGYGVKTVGNYYGKAAFGMYNADSEDMIFTVGNGVQWQRSNAFAVDKDGNIYCKSVIQTDGVSAAALLSDESVTLEYNVQSENIVEFGGITYTFETDENGAITQVTTSDGKTMQANIPAEISNLLTHNAAFMALAMMKLR